MTIFLRFLFNIQIIKLLFLLLLDRKLDKSLVTKRLQVQTISPLCPCAWSNHSDTSVKYKKEKKKLSLQVQNSTTLLWVSVAFNKISSGDPFKPESHARPPTPEVMKNSRGIFVPIPSTASTLYSGPFTVATPHSVCFLTGK